VQALGDLEFVACVLRALTELSSHETGRAAVAALRRRAVTVTVASGVEASVRVADASAAVSLALEIIVSREEIEAQGLALEGLLWAVEDLCAQGLPSAEDDALAEVGT
jgi:hypothetical protein